MDVRTAFVIQIALRQRLAAEVADRMLLDAGSGNGGLSGRLSDRGARVMGH